MIIEKKVQKLLKSNKILFSKSVKGVTIFIILELIKYTIIKYVKIRIIENKKGCL